jgi:16S rRNA (cytidine1402-2'-O)-methyltransferase
MPLYICPTPIGNLSDITIRVIRVLKNADLIAAEDTRKTRILLNRYAIETKTVSFHSYSSEKKLNWILDLLKEGKHIALVTDAGTPGISDPGYNLIKKCIDEDIHIESLPGPTSFVPALLLSGFPTAHFIFYGFLPRKHGKRIKVLKSFEEFQGPVIYFESPFRINTFISDVIEALGNMKIAIVRELTKIHEEVLRGNAIQLQQELENKKIKGEMIVIVGQKEDK